MMNQKKTGKKEIEKQLKDIANGLAPASVKLATPIIMTGAQCIREGGKLDFTGKPFVPDKVYSFDNGEVNHLHRLKKAYKSGGWEAVLKYSRKYVKKLAYPKAKPDEVVQANP